MADLSASNRRQALATLAYLATAGVSVVSSSVRAEEKPWPTKPIRVLIPYSAGGGTDVIARLVTSRLSELLKTPVIVDNRPGGRSIIAYEALLHEPADGYTFVFNNSSHAIQAAYTGLRYDPAKDLMPVTTVALSSILLLVSPSFPAKTMAEFIDYNKKNPGKVSFASFGAGTASHLYGEILNDTAKIDMQHVAYKGSAPALNDLMGNQIQVAFIDAAAAAPFVASGKVRALGITGQQRWKAFPQTPTFGELGYKDMAQAGWWGFVARRGIPAAVIARMTSEISKIVAAPDMAEKMQGLGAEPHVYTNKEFETVVASDMERWKRIVREKNIAME